MKMTVIPIVISARGTVAKGFVYELEDIEIRRRVEYWEESWRFDETYGDSCYSEKPSANTYEKNSQKNKKNNYKRNRRVDMSGKERSSTRNCIRRQWKNTD